MPPDDVRKFRTRYGIKSILGTTAFIRREGMNSRFSPIGEY